MYLNFKISVNFINKILRNAQEYEQAWQGEGLKLFIFA